MKITVDRETLFGIANAIKNLPVDCTNFDAADRWVGIVLALENLAQSAESQKTEEIINEE